MIPNVLRKPLFRILLISFFCSIFFYAFVSFLGGKRGVILSTTLFAQVHFLMTYVFSFYGVKRYLNNSLFYALGSYALLLGLTLAFYAPMLFFVSSFWGLMLLMGYFFTHLFENIFYFRESYQPDPFTLVIPPFERALLYVFISSVFFLAFLPHAEMYGSSFQGAAIRFFGIGSGYLIAGCIALLLFLLLIVVSKGRSITLFVGVLVSVVSALLLFLGSYFLDFLGLIYFTIIWHFFMWEVFYIWKLYKRAKENGATFTASVNANKPFFARLLGYAVRSPRAFIFTTFLFAFPIVVYFLIDYDFTRETFLSHPFYGQFAMFIWSFPHITLSFLPQRTVRVKAVAVS